MALQRAAVLLLALVLLASSAQGTSSRWHSRRLMQGDPNAGGLINTALTLDEPVTDAPPPVTPTGAVITNASLTGAPLDAQLNTFANKTGLNNTKPDESSDIFQNIAGLATGNTDPTTAGSALVDATSTGNIADAAGALLAVAKDGGAQATSNLGTAISLLAQTDSAGLGQVLGLSTLLAAQQGSSGDFINTAAQLFAANDQADTIGNFSSGVADAINLAGPAGSVTWGNALSEAVAGDNSSRQAVAKATASVLCEGGARASAWASAFSVLLSQNENGCLVLNEARILATAQCIGTTASSTTQSTASSTVLGFCGLPKNSFAPQSFTGSQSGATVTGNGTAEAGGEGLTTGGVTPVPNGPTLPGNTTATPTNLTLPGNTTVPRNVSSPANITTAPANATVPGNTTLPGSTTANASGLANTTTPVNTTAPVNTTVPRNVSDIPTLFNTTLLGNGSTPINTTATPFTNSTFDPGFKNSTVQLDQPVTNVTLVSASGQPLTSAALTAPAVQSQLASFARTAKINNTRPNVNTATYRSIAALATGGSNIAAAGAALVGAAKAGNIADAAGGVLMVAIGGSAQAQTNAAGAINQLANSNPGGFGKVLGLATLLSAQQGRGANTAFISTAAKLFNPANQPKNQPNAIKNLAAGVADAITNSGQAGAVTWGNAIAEALAGGDDGTRQALADASASVFCAGGCRASAWSSAISVALSQNADGCLVVNKAASTAFATCVGNAAQSFTQSTATSTILGFCGFFGGRGGLNLPPRILELITSSFARTESGASATGNCAASAEAGASTAGPTPPPPSGLRPAPPIPPAATGPPGRASNRGGASG